MNNIKAIHDLTGLIINAEGRVERISYLLKEVSVGRNKFTGRVELEGDQHLFSFIEYLTKDEIISFLQRQLQEESLKLSALQERFNNEHQ